MGSNRARRRAAIKRHNERAKIERKAKTPEDLGLGYVKWIAARANKYHGLNVTEDMIRKYYTALIEDDRSIGIKLSSREDYLREADIAARDLFNDYKKEIKQADGIRVTHLRVLSNKQAENLQKAYQKATGIRLDFEKIKFGQYNDLLNKYIEDETEGKSKEAAQV